MTTLLSKASLASICLGATIVFLPTQGIAGPYAASHNDSTNTYDAPIPGFVGPDGMGKAKIQSGVDIDGHPTYSNMNNFINPIFKSWGTTVVDYSPAPGVAVNWQEANHALGAVSGDNFNIVSLGELNDPEGSGLPGSITLGFSTSITNGEGADFAVFENAFASNYTTPGGSIVGQIFAELAFVEVSTDGINFVRFPSISLTDAAVGPYGSIDPTNVFNLAGKSTNAYGESWGTPFDLDDLRPLEMVIDGWVDLSAINYIRLVDIPGNGFFTDSEGRPIYDAWATFGSGGFDLDAIGAINIVPEPSTSVLLVLGIGALTLRRRKAHGPPQA